MRLLPATRAVVTTGGFAFLLLISSSPLLCGQERKDAPKPTPALVKPDIEAAPGANEVDQGIVPAAISPRPKDLKPAGLSQDQLTGRWETGIYFKGNVIYSVFGTPIVAEKKTLRPLVIYFHGEAYNAKEGLHLNSGARHFTTPNAQKDNPCVVITPFTPKGDMTESRTFSSLIEDAIRKYSVDPDRIYLVAVDLGGYSAGGLLVRKPGRFAAMIDIAGLTAFAPDKLDGSFAVWGIMGKATNSKTKARNNAVLGYLEELKSLGATINKTNLGVPHAHLEETFFANPKHRAWLFKYSKEKKKAQAPKKD